MSQSRKKIPLVSIIVAVAENGVIGAKGEMPWKCPSDLKRFKSLTLGKPVIMGRKTWESLGKPLPGRRNLVITRRGDFIAEGAELADSLESALGLASEGGAEEICIIGGGEIYAQAMRMDIVDRLCVTRIASSPEGDVFFPSIDSALWREVEREAIPATERDSADMLFLAFERRKLKPTPMRSI